MVKENDPEKRELRRQRVVGAVLGALILVGWLSVHIYGVFFFNWGPYSAFVVPALVALSCWLYVGMFILAHDCMHGSLVPGRPDVNRRIGQLCLTLYAGFDFDTLREKHRRHHRYAGTEADPDFDALPPHGFLHWYYSFFSEYFGLRQLAYMATLVVVYVVLFGASISNIVVFLALPAILSSLQLFTFGTYLPHRPSNQDFVDEHRTRSSDYSPLMSLLTCFHFGYHHAHHLHPAVPWWRLPEIHEPARSGA